MTGRTPGTWPTCTWFVLLHLVGLVHSSWRPRGLDLAVSLRVRAQTDRARSSSSLLALVAGVQDDDLGLAPARIGGARCRRERQLASGTRRGSSPRSSSSRGRDRRRHVRRRRTVLLRPAAERSTRRARTQPATDDRSRSAPRLASRRPEALATVVELGRDRSLVVGLYLADGDQARLMDGRRAGARPVADSGPDEHVARRRPGRGP